MQGHSRRRPLVSVIIPNYNHARYLARRFESILHQTYGNTEVLYLDDASTDASNAVAETFVGDGRVRYIYNDVNGGSPFKQWNKGIKEARGEYIWIAEADDYADEGLLEVLVAVLEAKHEVGLAYCQSQLIDSEDRIMRSGTDWTDDLDRDRWRQSYVNDGRDECRRYLSNRSTIPNASAVVFRRDIYLRASPPNGSYRFCGDWVTWASLLFHSDLAFEQQSLNFFRRHSDSAFTRATQDLQFALESYRAVSYIERNVGIPESELERTSEQLMDVWMGSILTAPTLHRGVGFREVYACAAGLDRRLHPRLARGLLKLPFLAIRRELGRVDILRRLYRASPRQGPIDIEQNDAQSGAHR